MYRDGIYNLIDFLSAYSILVPIVISLLKIRVLNRTLWTLLLYLLLSLVTDFLYLNSISDQRKADTIYNVWTISECAVLCLLFYFELNLRKARLLVLLGFACFALSAAFSLYDDLSSPDTVIATIEAGLMILITLGCFIYLLIDFTIQRPISYYFFWINLALMIYFSANILVFFTKPEKLIWGFHDIIAILTNFLISVGIWKVRKASIISF